MCSLVATASLYSAAADRGRADVRARPRAAAYLRGCAVTRGNPKNSQGHTSFTVAVMSFDIKSYCKQIDSIIGYMFILSASFFFIHKEKLTKDAHISHFK